MVNLKKSLFLFIAFFPIHGTVLSRERPRLRVGKLPDDLVLDGMLLEKAWKEAPRIENLTMVEPNEGARPFARTTVSVLASEKEIVIGIFCRDPEPSKIVSYSVARDSSLYHEDHVKFVLGTFMDGRTGYVFAVNPSGARYDALVAHRGEGENRSWDGIWEAKTYVGKHGWSAEVRIPILTLSFKQGLSTWEFNIRRKIQRLMEIDRWASPSRDFRVTHINRAGLLTGLPRFKLGMGISVKPCGVAQLEKESRDKSSDLDFDASLDLEWRMTPELLLALTFNTDFAETEVDTRRTNLTRFPLFFPEKRTFFLEGLDYFDFGLGLGRDIVPFHTRRIGLVSGKEVPLLFGGKLIGRMGKTSIGALAARCGDKEGVAPYSTMGVVRVKQDIWEQSNVGMIASFGDPLNRDDSWMFGADFTYQTDKMFGDKNFLVGLWGLASDRQGIKGRTQTASGFKIDYPNDLWDISLRFKRIDDDFDPSLGFVRRRGIYSYGISADYMPRPDIDWIRQLFFETGFRYITNLDGNWETWRYFTAPINCNLESGDSFEFNVMGQGENLDEGFEIAEGVYIPRGKYDWTRFRAVIGSASKRPLKGEIAYWFGPFYRGWLDTVEVSMMWNPLPLLSVSGWAEHNKGRMPTGNFIEDVYGTRIIFNFSPDLTLSNFLQYDTESESLGAFSRVRWTITPYSEFFFVIDWNLDKGNGNFKTRSYETTAKILYTLRF